MAAVIAVVSLAAVGLVRNPDIYFLIKKNFTIFSDVYKEVSLHYVDEVNPEPLMRKGINAMLESLDPYTVLIDEGQSQEMEIMTRGSYGGVGLNVGFRGGKIVVIAPMEGYSAHRKGIRTGDVIIAVGGVSVDDMTPDEVQQMTTGDPGSKVNITISRYGVNRELTFELERERIDVKNITYHGFVGENKDIGYILLSRFSQNTSDEVRNALEELDSERKLAGLILDVRNNPGGLLDEAIQTVDKFIDPGITVVETKGRLDRHNNSFKTQEPPMYADLPLVILQNGGSASASEIVSGAFQDLDRAVIVGDQSFGKGLVQVVRPLSYNTSLKITTSRYYIPSGRSIQSVTYTHDEGNNRVVKPDSMRQAFKTRGGRTVYDSNGIEPDVSISAETTSLLQTALLHQNHFFNFANKYAAEHDSLTLDGPTDELYREFRNFLGQQDFSYETDSQTYLAKVDSLLTDSGRSDDVSNHIAALEEAINREKEQAFLNQKEAINETLYMELVSRFKSQEGQTAASLPFDPAVAKAIEILYDQKQYDNILSLDK